MNTVWYTRKYICRNGIEERTKFPVRIDSEKINTRKASVKVKRSSRACDNAERQLARLLNNNFDAHKDSHIVLEYDEKGMQKVEKRAMKLLETGEYESMEDCLHFAAQKEAENFIRRIQRAKGDITLLYVFITSDMDGETGEMVRLHHHMVINSEALEIALSKWNRGYIHVDELYAHRGDFSCLASYLLKQVRYIMNAKRYTPSRTLQQPYISEPMLVSRFGESEMKTPSGCIELYRSAYVRGNAQYLRYYRPPQELSDSTKARLRA